MSGAFDNIHPGLTQPEAIRLLLTPIDQLESQSDPYMAAAHLLNFPGPSTEEALLALVDDQDQSQPRRLARRKAVEVLGRLHCQDAIPAIGRCLTSDDPYLVENSAWALAQLDCQVDALHQQLISLLSRSDQNQRVLIQSLAGLNVTSALGVIEPLRDSESAGVRGAAISACIKLGAPCLHLDVLKEHFLLPNQMDRQSGIQDAIDCCAKELLPSILQAPVSPVFRMRALRALWPEGDLGLGELSLLSVLDSLLNDFPGDLELVHQYDQPPTNEFLIQELFGTDFSRCYLALKTLSDRSAVEIWPLLYQRWIEEAHNDYGAHYFFVRLFGNRCDWPKDALSVIEQILDEAIASQRPQFMKSKSAAVLSLYRLGIVFDQCRLAELLSSSSMPFWESRYAALMVLSDSMFDSDRGAFLESSGLDPNPFVAARAQAMMRDVI
ncbi:phycoerythrobilin:Cys-82 alpha-phycoerythrin lyase/ CpeY subunit [Synechococcus sp. SYN20]|nr:phycoerythrobilin:Cys-82 alpha-phycoerythrin lyase CpeY subunit [Synechococcus sp. SYN20]QNJ24936.1 phycoerythrobilin:Cys-82 alpha-phycoerythrin lyase/ CpeY subunit [Synechococcus sp. SYN20]